VSAVSTGLANSVLSTNSNQHNQPAQQDFASGLCVWTPRPAHHEVA
jgi:hypothetical protein